MKNNEMNPLEPIRQLYVTDLFICFGKKQANKVYKSFGFDDELDFNDSVTATTYHIEGDRIIMYYSKSFNNNDIEEQAALIAHEAYHATEYLKSIIGTNDKAEEITAYLIQYLVRETMKRFKKKQ